jgi:exopolysaccharide biosynthesis protein
MFNFRRTDAGEITEEDLAAFADIVTIVTRTSFNDLATEVKKLAEKVEDPQDKTDGLNSIGVEYGRVNGASYVFARIPKTTNAGRKLKPKLHLTSEDGSIDGEKCSALSYAKKGDHIFTMNAGLFNTGTLQPVGQTIIDGVSYVNIPMTDDMGSPISDQECYPLCIDADGNLSAPYSRGVDTADMIADGVVFAVTGWGKIVDNFAPCDDTVKNEIVHAETYIRQVIGQYQNGDYFVCTVDKSRGSVVNEAGLTYANLAQMLVEKGVKFAYSLDGGGSAETVIGVRQLNPIYEGTVGRSVPTVITFEY